LNYTRECPNAANRAYHAKRIPSDDCCHDIVPDPVSCLRASL